MKQRQHRVTQLVFLLLTLSAMLAVRCAPATYTNALPTTIKTLETPSGDYRDVVWLPSNKIAAVYAPQYEIDRWVYDVAIYELAEETWSEIDVPAPEECISAWNLVLERLPQGGLGIVNHCNIEVERALNRYSRLLAWYPETDTIEVLALLPVGKDVISFDISPEGTDTLVSYDSSGGILGELVWIDSDGKAQHLMTEYMRARDGRYAPDGQRMALVASASVPDSDTGMFGERRALQAKLSHPWTLYLADRKGDNLHVLLSNIRFSFYLKWSPDGHYLAFSGVISGQSGIWIVDVSTGALYRVWERRTPFDWSPDGSQMVVIDGPENNLQDGFVPEHLRIIDISLHNQP